MSIFNSITNALGLNILDSNRVETASGGFGIDEFKANVLNKGLIKNNLFIVQMSHAKTNMPTKDFTYLINKVTLPAVDLNAQTVRRYGAGPEESIAFRPVFSGLDMDFYITNEAMNPLRFFNGFASSMGKFTAYNTVMDNVANLSDPSKAKPYEVAYKDDYIINLKVFIYNEYADNVMTYVFRDCILRRVSPPSLSWATNDQISTLGVQFSFTDYIIEPGNVTQGGGGSSLTTLQSLLKLGTVAETIMAIKKPQSVGDALNLVNNASVITSAF